MQHKKFDSSIKPYRNARKRKRSTGKCPFRIAELALPTKRQCIESWRQKSRVMPSHMVERLKQRIMDEKTVVQIRDAVYWFKNKKRGSRKRSKVAGVAYNCNRMGEFKTLSAIFGSKIIRKLMRPLTIPLDSRLEKINNIVKEEVESLVLKSNRKFRGRLMQQADTIIIEETTQKITLWIESILMDTNYKIIEESLRELEEEEGPVLDILDDLLDKSICMPIERQSSEELKEILDSTPIVSVFGSSLTYASINAMKILDEIYHQAIDEVEGRSYDCNTLIAKGSDLIKKTRHQENAIDLNDDLKKQITIILDQVIDIILNATLRDSRTFESDIDSKDRNYSFDLKSELLDDNEIRQRENSSQIIIRDVNDTRTNSDDNKSQIDIETIEESMQVMAAGSDIITNVKSFNEINNGELFQELNTNFKESVPEKFEDVDIVKSPSFDALATTGEINDFKDIAVREEVTNDTKINVSDHDEGLQFIDAENVEPITLNRVSNETSKENRDLSLETDAIELSEDGTEDNKKVKFSNIDMGLGVKTQSSSETLSHLPSTEERRSKISLSLPNNHLLSTADESWPEHIKLPLLKVIASVNKSVTSLGKIFEVDEKGTSSLSSYDSEQFSEIYVDVQPYYSISIDKNKMKDTFIAPFQNEKDIFADNKCLDINVKEKDVKKQLCRKIQNKSDHIIKNRGKAPSVVNSKSLDFHKTNVSSKVPKKLDRLIPRKIIKENIEKTDSDRNKTKKQTSKIKDIAKRLEGTRVQAKGQAVNKVKVIKKENTSKTVFRKPESVTSEVVRPNEDREVKSHVREKSKFTQKGSNKNKNDKSLNNDDTFKWCKDLEVVIENLETWNSWMHSTCSCIRYLKQKGNFKSSRTIERTRRKWKMLYKSIKQDSVLWMDMKRRNGDGLESYKKYYCEIGLKADKCDICNCTKI